jgi:acyl carrier protein
VNIEEKVIEIIVKEMELDPAEVTPEKEFIEDLGLDSLDVMTLAMEMEEVFGIEIPDEDVEGIKTVQDVFNYLHKRLD